LESCSTERGGLNTLAPSGYSLKRARTSLRFASSKLSLAHNPVKDQRREDGGEEDSLIPDRHYQSSEQNVPDEEMPLEFRKVFSRHAPTSRGGESARQKGADADDDTAVI
jgi:hypothetical protein